MDEEYSVRAGVLAVGDELLVGRILETHSKELAKTFRDLLEMQCFVVVRDHEADIVDALGFLHEVIRCDLVIVTGGLGPTHDDVTKKAVAQFVGDSRPFKRHEPTVLHITSRLKGRKRQPPNSLSLTMADLPQSVHYIWQNEAGSAPGLVFLVPFVAAGDAAATTSAIICLPGPPKEVKALADTYLRPFLMQRFPRRVSQQQS